MEQMGPSAKYPVLVSTGRVPRQHSPVTYHDTGHLKTCWVPVSSSKLEVLGQQGSASDPPQHVLPASGAHSPGGLPKPGG